MNYYHKYLVVENGRPLRPASFRSAWHSSLANVDNLGMDVEAKPYGSFEDEKLATPPRLDGLRREPEIRSLGLGRPGRERLDLGRTLLALPEPVRDALLLRSEYLVHLVGRLSGFTPLLWRHGDRTVVRNKK